MPFPDDFSPEMRLRAARAQIDARLIEEYHIRGSGHGGQKINKTNSCVQLVYPPLEIEIRCQEHREQHRNRTAAYHRLIEKVEEWRADVERQLAEHDYLAGKAKAKRPRGVQKKILKEKRKNAEKKARRKMIGEE